MTQLLQQFLDSPDLQALVTAAVVWGVVWVWKRVGKLPSGEAALRAAWSAVGRAHYTDMHFLTLDARRSAEAVRGMLDRAEEALRETAGRGETAVVEQTNRGVSAVS